MNKETRLLAAVLLLVVGPTAVLSMLSAWVLERWQTVVALETEMAAESVLQSVSERLETELAQADALLARSFGPDANERSGARDWAERAAALQASNIWIRRVFVGAPGGGLLYPPLAAAEPGTSADPADETALRVLSQVDALAAQPERRDEARRRYAAMSDDPAVPRRSRAAAALRQAGLLRAAGLAAEADQALRHAQEEAHVGALPCRDPDEGFLLCVVAAYDRAELARAQGDSERVLEEELALLDEALRHGAELPALQRVFLDAHFAAAWPGLLQRREDAPAAARASAWLRAWGELQAALKTESELRAEMERAVRGALADTPAGRDGGAWFTGRSGLYRVVRAGGLYAGYGVGLPDLLARLGEQAAREASAKHLRVAVRDRLLPADEMQGARPLARLALAAPLGGVRLEAYAADPQALEMTARLQARLYRWGVFLLGAGVLTGAGLVLRVAAREIAVARERSRFAASVSHDLRTPLASMRMLAESLLLGSIRDERMQRTFLDTIVRECDRLGQLTERALYFMRMGQNALTVQLTEGEIGSFVQETARAFAQRSREGDVDLAVEIEPGLPPVRFDGGAMAQVLNNLLDNAVKYTPAPPRAVEVRAARHLNGREVVISVRDHGMGMGPRDRKRLFREYYRGSRATAAGIAGNGLGLALCRNIVRAHGGRMEVDSAEGRGSTFRAILPVADGEGDLRP